MRPRFPGPESRTCISSSRCFVFSHIFFGFERLHAFSFIFSDLRGGVPAEHGRLLTRRLWPVNSSRPWCTMRSMIAAAEFVVEEPCPFTELDVRGEYDAPSFVAARDDLVEQGARRCRRVRSRTRQYDQVGTRRCPEHRLRSVPSRLALPSWRDELGGLMEPHAQPHVDRLHARSRDVSFAPGLAVGEHQVLRARGMKPSPRSSSSM